VVQPYSLLRAMPYRADTDDGWLAAIIRACREIDETDAPWTREREDRHWRRASNPHTDTVHTAAGLYSCWL